MDRVQVMKNETAALGGDDADTTPYPSPIAPQEDAVEAAGLYLQDVSNRDETTLVSRSGNDMTFKDGNNAGGLTLSQLVRQVSKVGTPADNQLAVWTGDGTLEAESDLTYDGAILGATKLSLTGPIRMTEVASPDGNTAGTGQIWVKDNTPNDLYFRDDTGVDHLISWTESEYAYLPGRTGGQTLYGGAEASQNLTLGSTANATKGSILFGAAGAFDEANARFMVGGTNPEGKIHIKTADSGITPGTAADELVIESNADVGLQVLTGIGYTAAMYFGTSAAADRAGLWYQVPIEGTEAMRIRAVGGDRMTVRSDAVQLESIPLWFGSGSYEISTSGNDMTFKDVSNSGGVTLSQLLQSDVDISGTPASNQVAVWNDANTLRGDAELTFDGSTTLHLDASTPIYWVEDTAAGATALSRTMAGIQISATSMDATNKYTPAVKFMSTDTALTTENPKLGAVIVGRATEAYAADTDGGMAIDFAVTADDPGTTSVPAVGMSLTSTGLGIGIDTPDTALHVHKSSAGSIDAHSKAGLVIEAADHLYLQFLSSATREQGILFGEVGDSNNVAGIFYGHSSDDLYYAYGGTTYLNVDSSGNVKIQATGATLAVGGNITADSTLHVYAGSAGTVTAVAGTQVTIEDDATAYLSFLTPNTATSGIIFADPDDNDIGAIKYDHSADSLTFRTGNGDRIIIDSLGRIGTGGETSPLGRVHIKGADVGDISPATWADELVLENNGSGGMTIYSAPTTSGYIIFGDVDNDTVGNIRYDHSTDTLSFTDATTGTKTLAELAAAGGGDVSVSGTPADNQVAVWTDATTIEGTTGLTFSGTNFNVSAAADTIFRITSQDDLEAAGGTENIASIEFEGQRNARYDIAAAMRVRQSGTWSTVTANYSPGAIEFFTQDGSASDTLTTPRMTIGPTGLVGIGTSDPQKLLHVQLSSTGGSYSGNTPLAIERNGHCNLQIMSNAANTGSVEFTNGGDTNEGRIYYDHAALDMSFWTAGGERMWLNSTGLGVNEGSPLGRIHAKDSDTGVASLGANYSTVVVEDNTAYAGVTVVSNTAHVGGLVFTDVADTFRGYVVYDHGATYTDQLSFGTAGNTRVAITSGGNVGINENVPLARLHAKNGDVGTISPPVGTSIVAENSGDTYVTVYSGNTSYGGIVFSDVDDDFVSSLRYDHSSGEMEFYVNNGARADMTSTYLRLNNIALQIDNTSTVIDRDGGGNMTFTDAVAGTKTLSQLAAGGDVSASGTPADNQIAVWTNSTTIEGDADLTWDGSQLVVKALPNPVIWCQNSSTAEASLSHDMDGIQLSAQAMDTSNEYTPAIKFMSTDANFTTTNPKMLAFIVGRATESYAADTDGGMALDFGVSHNNPGTATVPDVGMTLYQPTSGGAHIGVGESATSAPRHLYARSTGDVYVRIDRSGDYVEMGLDGTEYCQFESNGRSSGYQFDGDITINGLSYALKSGSTSLPFHTSAGEQMRLTGSGLGINETDPETLLHVTKSAGTIPSASVSTAVFQDNSTTGTNCIVSLVSGTAAYSRLNFGHASDLDSAYFDYSHSSSMWSWIKSSGHNMTFNTATGIFALGGHSTDVKIEVNARYGTTSDYTATLELQGLREGTDSGASGEIVMRDYANSTEFEAGAIRCNRNSSGGGSQLDFYTAVNQTGATLEMTLDEQGYLGLGESNPTYPFQIGANSSETFYVTTAGAGYFDDALTVGGTISVEVAGATLELQGRTGAGTTSQITMVGAKSADDSEICDVAFRNYVASEFEIANITAMVGPAGGGGDWGRLRLRALQDGSYTGDVNVLGDAQLWIQYDDEYTATAQNMAGLQLMSYSLDTTNKYTPAVQFGGYNSAIHGDPQTNAWIVGRATEAWSTFSDGGMAIDFRVSSNDPGASGAGNRVMIASYHGVAIGDNLNSSTYDFGESGKQVGGALHVYQSIASTPAIYIDGTDPAIQLAGGDTQAIYFGDSGDSDIGYIQYDHADDELSIVVDTETLIDTPHWGSSVLTTAVRKLVHTKYTEDSNNTNLDRNSIDAEGAFESGMVFHNSSISQLNVHTLPSAEAGKFYTFLDNNATYRIRFHAATGDTIRIAGVVSSSGGYATSGARGDFVTVLAINTTEWVAINSNGSWSLN